MPQKNYILTIGGVGTRILEAIIRLCECGYITQDELYCIMCDVDASNGNGNRIAPLIRNYNNCYELMLKGGDDHQIFKTKIMSALDGNAEYKTSPVQTGVAGVTLSNSFSDDDTSNVLKAYFSEDDREKEVNSGFYGKSLVGSIFTYRDLSDTTRPNAIGRVLDNIVAELESGTEIRLFIAGSAFGGTGASGMLPIVRTLVEKVNIAPSAPRGKLYICGVLMLPYFSWDHPREKDSSYELSKQLKDKAEERSKQVVSDYRDLMNGTDGDKIFNRLYVIGAPDKMVRGRFAAGGASQNNWPHIVELFAAAEASQFFDAASIQIGGNEVRKPPAPTRSEETMGGLEWTNYPDGKRLSHCIKSFLTVNLHLSARIAATVFDRTGNSKARPFEPKPRSIFRERKGKRLRKNNWIKARHFATGGFCTRSWRWKFADLHTPFNELFEYFTDSAIWYSKIIHDFNDRSKAYLPDLFGTSINTALRTRANLDEFSALLDDPNLVNNFMRLATDGLEKLAPPNAKIKHAANHASEFLAQYVSLLHQQTVIQGPVKGITAGKTSKNN